MLTELWCIVGWLNGASWQGPLLNLAVAVVMKQFNARTLSKPAQSDRRPWQAILAPPEPAVRTCFLSLFFCRQVGSHLLQELAPISEPGTPAKSQAPAWLPYPSSGCAYCSLFPLNEPLCRRPVLDTIRGPEATIGWSKGFSEDRIQERGCCERDWN